MTTERDALTRESAFRLFDTGAITSDNPLGLIMQETARPDLARVVNTISIRFDSSSEVTEYPVESGRNIADHAASRPLRITIDGLVTGDALSGRGPREVDAQMRRLQDEGVRVNVSTPRGTFANCVITRLESSLGAGNVRSLDFTVDFTQVHLAEITSIDTLPIFDDYARDVAFNEYLELSQPGLDTSSNIVEDDEDEVVRVQARLLDVDRAEFVRNQFENLRAQGIDIDETGRLKDPQYAREILDLSAPLFMAQQDINPQPIVGINTFEIDLLSVETLQETLPPQLRSPTGRPTRFPIEVQLRDLNDGVFTLVLNFEYEYALTPGGASSPIGDRLAGRGPMSQGRWQIGYSASRNIGPSFFGIRNPLSRVTGDGIRIQPNVPILLGDGNDFGMIMAIPRYGDRDASVELTTYRAFVGINGREPTYMMLHIDNPDAFVRSVTGEAATNRIRTALRIEELE